MFFLTNPSNHFDTVQAELLLDNQLHGDGKSFSFLLPIQISYLCKSKVMIFVEAGGLLVQHLVGHLFKTAKLLLIFKDRMKMSSPPWKPPALPQTESSIPTGAS